MFRRGGDLGSGLITDSGQADLALGVNLGHNRPAQGFERWTVNEEDTLLGSAARTATTAQEPTHVNISRAGVRLYLDITAAAASENLILQIQSRDPVTGNWVTLIQSEAITATGTYTLGFNDCLPRRWRGRIVHSASGSWTYSVGYVYTC